jgi:hypothetical protein
MAITLNGTTGISNDGGYTGDGVSFADTTPANTLVTTTGGNVGIGTSTPTARLDVTGSSFATANVNFARRTDDTTVSTAVTWSSSDGNYMARNNGGALTFNSGNTIGSSAGTERMRITSDGNLMVGTTTTAYGGGERLSVVTSGGGGGTTGAGIRGVNQVILGLWNQTVGSSTLIAFAANTAGDGVGSVTTNGTNTSYNTSSDYRLKENIAPMTGALAKVSALKPCTYTWKSTGDVDEGFIAHELAEVCPSAVTGEKDAVETYTDEDGNEQTRIKPQGIDTSFLVATLTAAIQEQQAIITDLKSRIEALEQA